MVESTEALALKLKRARGMSVVALVVAASGFCFAAYTANRLNTLADQVTQLMSDAGDYEDRIAHLESEKEEALDRLNDIEGNTEYLDDRIDRLARAVHVSVP